MVVAGEGYLWHQNALVFQGVGVEVPNSDFFVSSSGGKEVETALALLFGLETAGDDGGNHLFMTLDVKGFGYFNLRR